jgi:hypothetical protein
MHQHRRKHAKPKKRRKKGLRYIWATMLQRQFDTKNTSSATRAEYQTHINAWDSFWMEKSGIEKSEINAHIKGWKKKLNVASPGRRKTNQPSVGDTEVQYSPGNKPRLKTPGPPFNRITRRHIEEFREWVMPGRSANVSKESS